MQIIAKGNSLIVDVSDAPELASGGKLKGAVNVSRGMLEFRADPDGLDLLRLRRGRAALIARTLKELGYQSVYNAGGFKELATPASKPSRHRMPSPALLPALRATGLDTGTQALCE